MGRGVAVAAVAGLGLAAAGLLVGTWEQSKVWQTSENLWESAVGTDPACALCQMNLGNVLYGQRRYAEAEIAYRRAVALRPDLPGAPQQPRHLAVRSAPLRPGRSRVPDGDPALAEARRRTRQPGRPLRRAGTAGRRPCRCFRPRSRSTRASRGSGREPARPSAPARSSWRETAGWTRGSASTSRPRPVRRPEPEILRDLGQKLVETGAPGSAVEPLHRLVAFTPDDPLSRFWLARALHLSGNAGEATREIAALQTMDAALAARVRE